jgi:hypothetical protein
MHLTFEYLIHVKNHVLITFYMFIPLNFIYFSLLKMKNLSFTELQYLKKMINLQIYYI